MINHISYTDKGVVILNQSKVLPGNYDYNDVIKMALESSLEYVTFNDSGACYKINVYTGEVLEVN